MDRRDLEPGERLHEGERRVQVLLRRDVLGTLPRRAGHPFEHGFDIRLVPEKLEQPIHWRRPRKIFVNSMSDRFHEDVPTEFIARVGHVMRRADWHIFQVLTKRHERPRELLSNELLWMGDLAMATQCTAKSR